MEREVRVQRGKVKGKREGGREEEEINELGRIKRVQ